ncbi:MAG: phosphoglucosamine mutase [Alphaproteobacteria bacterium]|nr:phosphoglucosamine mutase [Alphaproteobacteria bacterium]
MSRKYFGTDGIRGTANAEPMTAEIALKVGMAAGRQFIRGDHRHRVVIGKDTRLSGYLLEPALTAGFISVGIDVVLVGPMPTPAVAMLTRSLRADLGVVISASHNPYEDNGIKLFGPDGFKLSDEVERQIEARMENGLSEGCARPADLGRASRLEDAPGRYIEYVKHTFPDRRTLDGFKIVVDCANGAAYRVAPTVLYELGADVVPICVEPDGFNINKDCGSTDTARMREEVVREGAHLGIALDGDADRIVMCDENGQMIDGDQLMTIVAESWMRQGRLKGGGVVSTVMSNLGFERYLTGLGLTLERAAVGDRYVVEHMRAKGYNVGGEQSGHIILTDYSTTGDALIAALQTLAVLAEKNEPVSKAARIWQPIPQQLRNVRHSGGRLHEHDAVQKAIANASARLGKSGRVLVRPSGTEPLIRVMVEGDDAALVMALLNDITQAVEQVSRVKA